MPLPRMQSRGAARPDDCIASGNRSAGRCREADLRIWGAVGRGAAGSTFDDEAAARTSAVRGVAARNRARCRSPVTGSGCGSPRAVLSPSSGQGVGDGCGDSRGVPRFQRRLPRDYARSGDGHPGRRRIGRRCWAGRGTRSINKAQLPERRPPARSTTPATAEQPGRGRNVRVTKGSIRDDLLRPIS